MPLTSIHHVRLECVISLQVQKEDTSTYPADQVSSLVLRTRRHALAKIFRFGGNLLADVHLIQLCGLKALSPICCNHSPNRRHWVTGATSVWLAIDQSSAQVSSLWLIRL